MAAALVALSSAHAGCAISRTSDAPDAWAPETDASADAPPGEIDAAIPSSVPSRDDVVVVPIDDAGALSTPPTEEELCIALAARDCDYLQHCADAFVHAFGGSRVRCLRSVSRDCLEAARAGRLADDFAPHALACLEAGAGLTCAELEASWREPGACDFVRGRGLPGDACTTRWECGADPDRGAQLTCERTGTPDPYSECAVGRCGPGTPEDDECDPWLDVCAPGLSCLPPHEEAPGPFTCRHLEEGALDGPCLDMCPRGTYCERDGFVCRQESAEGGPCTSYAGIADPQCGWRTECAYRTCVPAHAVTEPCEPGATWGCAGGVSCDAASRTCVERPVDDVGPAAEGETCGGLAPSCAPGLTCARFGSCRVCP